MLGEVLIGGMASLLMVCFLGPKFIEFIRNDAVASMSEAETSALHDLLAQKPVRKSALENLATLLAGRPSHAWTLDELSSAAEGEMKGRNFDNGRKMFGAAACFACHRFGNEGGMTGPDLTGAERNNLDFLLSSLVDPSALIRKEYQAQSVALKDGRSAGSGRGRVARGRASDTARAGGWRRPARGSGRARRAPPDGGRPRRGHTPRGRGSRPW